MKTKLALIAVLIFLASSAQSQTVQIHVLPNLYQLGTLKSRLATPVVDEVVRLKPDTVHISSCRSTPGAKLTQFIDELSTRMKSRIIGGFFENCPEISS